MTQKISQESWKDIYTVFFETKTVPSVYWNESMVSAIHHMMYLPPEDVALHAEEKSLLVIVSSVVICRKWIVLGTMYLEPKNGGTILNLIGSD